MRSILSLTITIIANLCYSQNVTLQQTNINEQIYKGTIDENIPITIYLKSAQFSPEDFSIISVEGWYYYDKIGEKIPLVGISHRGLTLYRFNSQEKIDQVLNFDLETPNFWRTIDSLTKLEDYVEKFDFEFGSKGIWFSDNKKLSVEIPNITQSPSQRIETLNFYGTNINLNKLFEGMQNFNVTYVDPQEAFVVLQYESPSRSYAMGRCGAGIEAGLSIIYFDENHKLKNSIYEPLESCLQDIFVEAENYSNGIYTYNIYHSGENYTLLYNEKNGTLKKIVQ